MKFDLLRFLVLQIRQEYKRTSVKHIEKIYRSVFDAKQNEREKEEKRAGAWCSHYQPDTQTNFGSKLRFAYAVSQSIEIQFLVFFVCPFICYCVISRERCCCSVGCCRSLCTSKTETTGKGIVLFTCNLWLWAYVFSHSFHYGIDCIRSYRRYTSIFFSLVSISFAFSTEQHTERTSNIEVLFFFDVFAEVLFVLSQFLLILLHYLYQHIVWPFDSSPACVYVCVFMSQAHLGLSTIFGHFTNTFTTIEQDNTIIDNDLVKSQMRTMNQWQSNMPSDAN